MESPINRLERELWHNCVRQVNAEDEATAVRWQSNPWAWSQEGFVIEPIPSSMQPLVEQATTRWKEIEEKVCSDLKMSREQFLTEFGKARVSFLAGSDEWTTFAALGHTVYGAVTNFDIVNLFTWYLPAADPDRRDQHQRIGRMVAAIFYTEMLFKCEGLSRLKISGDLAHTFDKLEARWRLMEAYSKAPSETASLKNEQKPSKFVRHIEPQILMNLKESDLFKNHLLPDLKKGEVFPAFRNNRIDFYYGGGKLFSYSDKGFVTHIKYASVLVGKHPYISEDELQKPEHIQSFAAGYARIKENCARYSGLEAIGVSAICAGFKSIFKNDAQTIIPLDIEISFSTEIEPPMEEQSQIGNRTDRIDLLLFNTETKQLRFYEAKHNSNHELWPKGANPPQVIEQLGRYQKLVTENQQNIVKQYENYVDLLVQLFGDEMPKPLPEPLGIDETPVLLLAYGYDRQQESRIKALLKDNMQDSPYYSCGTANTDRLGSMWNWKPKKKP
jgi:hypothetical protein